MKHFCFLALLLTTTLAVDASSLDRRDSTQSELMKQVALTAREITELTFPRPEDAVDHEADEFQRRAKWFERDIAALEELAPGASESTEEIYGAPFAEQVRIARMRIETNRAALHKYLSERPRHEALREVDWAVRFAKVGPENSFEELKFKYDTYLNGMRRANEIDPRAVPYRYKEIAEVHEPLMQRYAAAQALRNEAQKADAKARADELAEHQKAKARLQARRDAEARKLGFDGASVGLLEMHAEVRDGVTSLTDAKKLLIYLTDADDFRAQSIVGSHAIFATREAGAIVQVAVLRSKDLFYGEGAPLQGRTFAITGKQSFRTVLGETRELLTLRQVQ